MTQHASDVEVWERLTPLMKDRGGNRLHYPDHRLPTKTAFTALVRALAKKSPDGKSLSEQLSLTTHYDKVCTVQPYIDGHSETQARACLVSVEKDQVAPDKLFPVTLYMHENRVVIRPGWH